MKRKKHLSSRARTPMRNGLGAERMRRAMTVRKKKLPRCLGNDPRCSPHVPLKVMLIERPIESRSGHCPKVSHSSTAYRQWQQYIAPCPPGNGLGDSDIADIETCCEPLPVLV